MVNTKLVTSAALAALIAGVSATANQVKAQSTADPQDSLITRLAERFGKPQGEIKAVFDEVRSERQVQQEAIFEAKLTEAVTNGKLTEEQKQLLLQKHDELRAQHQAERDSFRALSPEEKQAKRSTQRQEMVEWAAQHGIDLDQLGLPMGPGMGRGQRGMGMHR